MPGGHQEETRVPGKLRSRSGMFGKTKVQGDLTAKKIMPKGGTQAKSKIGGSRRGEARDKAAARRKFKVPAPAGWVCKTNQEIDEAADNEVQHSKSGYSTKSR